MEGKNSENFLVDIKAQGQLLSETGIIQGEIKNEKEIELEISISSTECGEKMAYFFIEVDDGASENF
jgi:hypothetical protein